MKNLPDGTKDRPKGMCWREIDNGKCDIKGCKFTHKADVAKAQKSKDSKPSLDKDGKQTCRFFLMGKCTRGANCNFSHEKVDDKMSNAPAASMMSASAVSVAFGASGDAGDRSKFRRVLVDSGANEVVRPYHEQWWKEIMSGQKGRPITVSLAGGNKTLAAMTQTGEVMLERKFDRTSGYSWIVPVSRLVRELGAKLEWNIKGLSIQLPSGKKCVAELDDGLAYLSWEDFEPLRNELVTSHRLGRAPIGARFCAKQVDAELKGEDSRNCPPSLPRCDAEASC